jgi:phosphatidate cytidylyltransferase
MLKQRIITGLILAVTFLSAVIFLPTEALALVLGCVMMIAAWEWTRLAVLNKLESLLFYLAMAGGMFGLYCFPKELQIDQWLLWTALLWWSGITVIILRYKTVEVDHSKGLVRLSKSMMGLVALLPAWWALVQLHSYGTYGFEFFIFTFFIVWFADVGAYFSGKSLGKNKLAPNVSPGKTIEGMLGGLTSVVALSLAASFWFEFKGQQQILFVLMCAVIAIYSVFGDLFESLMKRQAGIKDSSNLLPGHGGVLDRIDSVLAAAPLFLFGLISIIQPA